MTSLSGLHILEIFGDVCREEVYGCEAACLLCKSVTQLLLTCGLFKSNFAIVIDTL